MDTQNDIRSNFGLRKLNFVLNPLSEEDAAFFADRTGVNVSKLVEDLQIDLSTGLPPKRMLWGPYGGGKTHTLQHIRKKLQELTSIYSVYVECPDLSKRSTFLELYRDGILRACGQDFIMGLFEKLREKIGYKKPEEVIKSLKEAVDDEELAKAVAILTNPTDKNILLLWTWFSGVPVSRSDLSELGQTQDLTSAEPARLASYITIIGKILKDIDDKSLLIVIDEVDRIGFVGSDTIVQFRTAFTRLMDPNQEYLAILLGISAKNFPELPEVFDESGPVVSRIGRDAVQEIPMIDEVDFEPFISNIIQYFRDPETDLNKLIENAKKDETEKLSEKFFPFTDDAIEALKAEVGIEMTPREITLKMTRAAGKAFNQNCLAINSNHI